MDNDSNLSSTKFNGLISKISVVKILSCFFEMHFFTQS